MKTKWQVIFYELKQGDSPVEDFFYEQQPQAQAKMLHCFELLETHGYQLGMPHSKQMSSEICELRIRGKEELRIFYAFSKKTIYLLHGFKKQTRKTPRKEFEIAYKRWTSI